MRKPSVEDWHRFDDIARRVFVLELRDHIRLSESMITTLYTTRPTAPSPLLPNVQTVECEEYITDIIHALLFLPASVRNLTIWAQNNEKTEEDMIQLVQILPRRFPELQSLDLGGLERRHSTLLASILPHLPHLRYFHLDGGGLSTEIATAMAEHSFLDTLVVGDDCDPLVEGGPPFRWITKQNVFAALRDLTIDVIFDQGVVALLKDISQSHSLRSLYIATKARATPSDGLDALGEAIGRHTGLRFLYMVGVAVDVLDARFVHSLTKCTAL